MTTKLPPLTLSKAALQTFAAKHGFSECRQAYLGNGLGKVVVPNSSPPRQVYVRFSDSTDVTGTTDVTQVTLGDVNIPYADTYAGLTLDSQNIPVMVGRRPAVLGGASMLWVVATDSTVAALSALGQGGSINQQIITNLIGSGSGTLYYQTAQANEVSQPHESAFDLTGAAVITVAATDDSAHSRTKFTISMPTEAQGTALMGPIGGPAPVSAALPTFRAISTYDLPHRYLGAYNYQFTNGVYRIGLSYSSDGRKFSRLAEPVIDLGGGGAFDSTDVFQPSLVDVLGVYYLYYVGYNGTKKQFGLARSFDGGVTWTKYASNPILTANGSGWEDTGSQPDVIVPYVMYDPYDSDSTQRFKMWYVAGLFGSGGVGYAYSSDGLSWTKYASNPVLTPGTAGQFDDTYMSTGPVVRLGGTYYIFYAGDHPVAGVDHWKQGIATFSNPKSNYSKSVNNPILVGDSILSNLTANVNIGDTTLTVAATGSFAVGMAIWVADGTNHYLTTITAITSSTVLTVADAAPVAVGSSGGNVRSAAYNSYLFDSALYDNGWRFYGTGFQPGFDNSHPYEVSIPAYANPDLSRISFDYENGKLIDITATESDTTGASRENPSVLDLFPSYNRALAAYVETIQSGGTAQIQRPVLDFEAGSNVTLTPADDPTNNRTKITIAASGGGSSSPLTTKGDVWGYSSVDARIPVGTNGQVLTADSTQTLGVKWSATGTAVYPKRATMWGDEFIMTTGTPFVNHDTSQNYSTYFQPNPAANSDAFSTSFVIDTGSTYILTVLCVTAAGAGQMQFAIDGSNVGSAVDFYNASTTYNVVVTIASSISLTAGYHKLTGTITGKNASSSSYAFYITKIWIAPSSD